MEEIEFSDLDVAEIIGQFVVESEYIIYNVCSILHLYTDDIWTYHTSELSEEGKIRMVFANIENEELDEAIELWPTDFYDPLKVESVVQDFANSFTKGQSHSVSIH